MFFRLWTRAPWTATLVRAFAAGYRPTVHPTAELAAANVPVVFRLPFASNTSASDRGKGEDDRWVELDVPARLVAAGAKVAITSSAPRDLLFAMRVASRGGLEPAAALRAVTLAPAQMLGVA